MSELSVYEVLNRKRRGGPLQAGEIEEFINQYTVGTIPDYQMSALLMAIAINGMTAQEMATLTQAMLRSGEQWHLRDQYDFFADKHSTGGVGDKVSLVLSPWVAACGIKIGMLSGRGLGHTGGTLDKLEAIPGFNARLSRKDFERCVAEAGCAGPGRSSRTPTARCSRACRARLPARWRSSSAPRTHRPSPAA